MPTSYYQVIAEIVGQVVALAPASILDLGVGFGKYGMLCREVLDIPYQRYAKKDWLIRIDGVEGWKPYRNPIHDYVYNRVFYGKIEAQLPTLGRYDVVLLIDVLEHFSKEDGLGLVRQILKHTNKALLVSTPLVPAEQGSYLGNALETHRSRWTEEDFQEFRTQSRVIPVGGDEAAQIFTVLPDFRPTQAELTPALLREIQRVDAIWGETLPARKGPLRITYVLPAHHTTGGIKMLLEQMRRLRQRGHRVYAMYRGEPGTPVIPAWSDLKVDAEILVGENEPLSAHLPDSDVTVVGWYHQLNELSRCRIPVMYWEQGHEYLFGDVAPKADGIHWDRLFQRAMYLPVALTAVSTVVQEILAERFGRRTGLVPNGIDTDRFSPGPRPNRNRVLLVGNPQLEFKGFEVALRVLDKVYEQMPTLDVTWVCQIPPKLRKMTFPIRLVVNPSQQALPKIYREHDLFLFTSWYEAFALPPLEAMASGLPVVATNCLGIETYARPGENCLLADPGDVESLAWGVLEVLGNPDLAEELRMAGRKTAHSFHWDRVLDRLEEALYRVASLGQQDGHQ